MAQIGQIQRYLLLIRRIRRGDFPSKEKLVAYIQDELISHGIDENIGDSERTVSRDIKAIKKGLGIIIEYSKQENGYYISKEDAAPSIDIEQILEPFDILNSLQADTGLKRVVYPEAYRPLGTEYLFQLIQAAKKCLQVTFCYSKFHLEDGEIRTVEPYALKQCRGRWYLLGIDAESEDNSLKSFGLDRIKGLDISLKKFKPISFDVKEKYSNSFGIMTYEHLPVEDIILEFDEMDGKYLKSVPLHHSQKILEDTPERFAISVRLRITHDFLMEIASRCFSLQVVSPESLKIQMTKLFDEAAKRNGLSSN